MVAACLVAAFAGALSQLFEGMGQELFNGREIAVEMRAIGQGVAEGSKPLLALAVVVGVAVLCEGSEVAVFLYGVAASRSGRARRIVLSLI